MELFGMPLFSEDIYKMLFRFAINIVSLTLIIRGLYYRSSKRKDYVFTYYMISTIVFLIGVTLKKFELDLGMALGLFAIFGILRYRTDAIEIKEMTYLFVVIGVSIINALTGKQMSGIETLTANIIVVLAIVVIEWMWTLKQELSKEIIYEKIENIKPEKRSELIADLEKRTGLKINKVEVGKINFLTDTAILTITYFKNQ